MSISSSNIYYDVNIQSKTTQMSTAKVFYDFMRGKQRKVSARVYDIPIDTFRCTLVILG